MLIIGGFVSVTGAIVGGLIIGATEKLAEIYGVPFLEWLVRMLFNISLTLGGIELWFAYVMALLFLLIRPEGLFGEKRIDRV